MASLVPIDQTDPLKKPVNALAIVAQNKRITVLGRKIYNVMLCSAQAQGLDKTVYKSLLKDIVSGLDYESNDQELIKQHLRTMATTTVEWQSPTSGEGRKWTVSGLIAHATLENVTGQTWLTWSYAEPMKQELLDPSVFAQLSLSILAQMHTHAGVALYEICSRYKAIGRTARQHWRWWQPVLTGQPASDKLAKVEYRFFKRDTMKKAIAEVCAITDLDIELVEYKEGKFIADLQFLVRAKVQASLPLRSPPKPIDLSIIQDALKIGVPDEKTEELLAAHGEDAVKAGLKTLEKRIATAFPEPLRDPYRYLKAILVGEQIKEAASKPTAEEQKARDEAEMLQKQSAAKSGWHDEWLRRRNEQIVNMLEEISEAGITELEQQLDAFLIGTNAHPSIVKRLRASGWTHPLVKHLMIDFYAKGTIGEAWNVPSAAELLHIASQAG